MGPTISRIGRLQGALRHLSRATTVRFKSQARAVGFDSALPLQVVSGRKVKSNDRGAYSSARESSYWIQMEAKKIMLRGRCQPQARILGFESAQSLQVVSGRKVKSHVRGAHSSTRWYWLRLWGTRKTALVVVLSAKTKMSVFRVNL